MFFDGAPLRPDIQKTVEETLKDRLDNFEVSFDEIYHKEMKVVD